MNTYQFKYLNQGAINNLGYSLSEIKELTPIDIKPEYTKSSFDKLLEPLKTGTTKMISFETAHRRKNGTTYPVEVYLHLSKQEEKEVFLAVINDITEKKKFEEEVIKNEQRYTDLVNNMSEGVYQSTTDGRFLNVNPAMVKMFGYQSVEEMLAIDIKKELYFKPEDRGNTYPEAGNDKHSELQMKKKDGSPIWVADSGWYIKNEKGEVIRHEGILQDITERKKAENKLKENNTRLELAMKTANMAWWEMDIATGNVIFEKRKAEMLGYAPELFKHYTDFTKLLHPEDYPKAMQAMGKHLEGKVDKYEVEYRILSKSGKYKWFYDIGSIVKKDAEEKPLKITGLVIDISERKEAEEKIAAIGKEWQATFNSVSDAIWIMGTDGKIIRCNKASEKLLEMKEAEMHGRFCWEVMHRTNEPIKECPVLCLKESHKREMFIMQEKNRWLEVTVVPMFDENEQIVGIVHVVTEVTERKQMEEAIKHVNEELERRVKLRTAQLEGAYNEMEAFTYSVSHDLRAPLRAIDGFSKMLLQDYSDIDPEALRLLNVISQSSSNMSKLIEDLLAFSRVGRANIATVPISMKEMVQSIVTQIKKETNCKHTVIKIGDLANVSGDKTLLNQVWTNLIRNAIKFSFKKEHPLIEIGCLKEQNEIIYFIKDNGVGFDMQYVDKLFGVFQRLHSSDEFEGTGIGLAIVKKAIDRHGGRVWAESIESEGASFYFTLPI